MDNASKERERIYREEYHLPSDPPPPLQNGSQTSGAVAKPRPLKHRFARFVIVYFLLLLIGFGAAVFIQWYLSHPEHHTAFFIVIIILVLAFVAWLISFGES